MDRIFVGVQFGRSATRGKFVPMFGEPRFQIVVDIVKTQIVNILDLAQDRESNLTYVRKGGGVHYEDRCITNEI